MLRIFSSFCISSILCLGTTRRDDDIISRQVKTPKGPRAQNSCELVSSVQERNPLEPARVDSPSLQHRVIHIADARIDICIWIEFQEMRDHELRSPEVDEPVTYDGDFILMIHFPQILLFSHLFSIFFSHD